MQTIDSLLEILKKNDEIAKKFHAIETKILSILDFSGIFEVLLNEIQKTFQIPYVWLTLIDTGDVSELLPVLANSKALETSVRIITPEDFFSIIPNDTRPLLVNDDLKPYYRLFPTDKTPLIKSIAITPITLDGCVIGSLNQADFSARRFSPDIDTSLLEQLAIKVSLCLSNVTAHEKLKFLAYHDPLTGVLNRRVIESILNREFWRARRYHNPLALVFLDIDHFKKMNDRYGHDAGDRVLVYFAQALEDMVRNSDTVARFAGDEFIVILPETTAEKAEFLMERIRTYFLENPIDISGILLKIPISYGVSSNENPLNKSPEALIKEADNRLYKMKSERRK